MKNLNRAVVLAFGTLLMLGVELTQVHEGHWFAGYNIALAIIGCVYFITAIRVLGIIQREVS